MVFITAHIIACSYGLGAQLCHVYLNLSAINIDREFFSVIFIYFRHYKEHGDNIRLPNSFKCCMIICHAIENNWFLKTSNDGLLDYISSENRPKNYDSNQTIDFDHSICINMHPSDFMFGSIYCRCFFFSNIVVSLNKFLYFTHSSTGCSAFTGTLYNL